MTNATDRSANRQKVWAGGRIPIEVATALRSLFLALYYDGQACQEACDLCCQGCDGPGPVSDLQEVCSLHLGVALALGYVQRSWIPQTSDSQPWSRLTH